MICQTVLSLDLKRKFLVDRSMLRFKGLEVINQIQIIFNPNKIRRVANLKSRDGIHSPNPENTVCHALPTTPNSLLSFEFVCRFPSSIFSRNSGNTGVNLPQGPITSETGCAQATEEPNNLTGVNGINASSIFQRRRKNSLSTMSQPASRRNTNPPAQRSQLRVLHDKVSYIQPVHSRYSFHNNHFL